MPEDNLLCMLGRPAMCDLRLHRVASRQVGQARCSIMVGLLMALLFTSPLLGQEKDFNAYPEHVSKYLSRLYDKSAQPLAFREDYPGGFEKWQQDARAALRLKLGLDRIAASVGQHHPTVQLYEATDLGEYSRQRGVIETEPNVRIPFWLLKPKSKAPCPLGVFPHGHDARGHHTTAGVYADEAHKRKSVAEDRDVAVQAVKLGFVAIAPAVRGLATDGVPDLYGRHGKRNCRSQVMHCLLAGRTAVGERVWDMERILDWAVTLPEVDSKRVLMMGNSGGGMVTIFTARLRRANRSRRAELLLCAHGQRGWLCLSLRLQHGPPG